MRRGEIWWADLGQPAGRRPVLVLTRNSAIPVLAAVVVAPITRTVRGIASELPLGSDDGLGEECAANLDSLLTVAKQRFDPEPATRIGADRLPELDRALRFALEISF